MRGLAFRWLALIQQMRNLLPEGSGLGNLSGHVGQRKAQSLKFADRMSELLALLEICPRVLEGCPGDDREKVKNALVDPDEFRGRDILVVGGTDSAIEVVLALCENNRVFLSCRGAKFDRVKPKNLKLIEAVIAAGKCVPRFATAVAEVGERTVVLESKQDKTREELPNDAVFAMIGGNPPIKWLQQIGVPYVDKPHSWSPARTDELVEKR